MRIGLISLIAVLALALAAPAMAQDEDAYQNVAGQEQQVVAGVEEGNGEEADAPAQAATSEGGNGSLPFTGFQAGLVLVLGLGLVGTGLVIRRVSRGGSQA